MNKLTKFLFRILPVISLILFVSTACTGEAIKNKDALNIAIDNLLLNGSDLSDQTDIKIEADSDDHNIVIITIILKSPNKNEISYGGGFVYTIDKKTGKILKAVADP